jgi:hypothetical protein
MNWFNKDFAQDLKRQCDIVIGGSDEFYGVYVIHQFFQIAPRYIGGYVAVLLIAAPTIRRLSLTHFPGEHISQSFGFRTLKLYYSISSRTRVRP